MIDSQTHVHSKKLQPDIVQDFQKPTGTNGKQDETVTEGKIPEDSRPSTLVKVPSVVHVRGAGVTHIGYGPLKRENQDIFCVHEEFALSQGVTPKGCSLFGVWDGHGTRGRNVSVFCQQKTPAVLSRLLSETSAGQLSDASPNAMATIDKEETRQALVAAFTQTDAEVNMSPIDCSLSGSTASVALVCGPQLFVATAGDSRVVMGTWDAEAKQITAEPLSLDHRPARADERKRCLEAGGRVQQRKNSTGGPVGSERLWLQDIDSPGLMVTRSIGDAVAASVGCTSAPEVVHRILDTQKHKFLVMGSDGLWDVLDNQTVVNIVHQYDDVGEAAKELLKVAMNKWEQLCSADNITIVVVRFYAEHAKLPKSWEPPVTIVDCELTDEEEDEYNSDGTKTPRWAPKGRF